MRIFILSCFSQGIFASVIMPGIDFTSKQLDQYTTVYVLNVDSKKHRITAYRAKDLGSTVAFAGQFAQHFSAVAVINGGFFRANADDLRSIVPAGALKIDDFWYGIAYKQRGAVGWDPNNGTVVIDRIQTKTNLIINNINLPVNIMNKLPANGKAALFNDSYIDPIEVDNAYVLVIQNNKITAIENVGKFTVPPRGYIYYVKLSEHKEQYNFAHGDQVKLTISPMPQLMRDNASISKWQNSPYIVAGGPLLLKNKQRIDDYSSERMGSDFLQTKHARTAVGITADTHWVMVAVSKNYLVGKGGMTISELAYLMRDLGCVDALNLDGGGSTAMYVQNALDFNMANPVADVIAVVPRS